MVLYCDKLTYSEIWGSIKMLAARVLCTYPHPNSENKFGQFFIIFIE